MSENIKVSQLLIANPQLSCSKQLSTHARSDPFCAGDAYLSGFISEPIIQPLFLQGLAVLFSSYRRLCRKVLLYGLAVLLRQVCFRDSFGWIAVPNSKYQSTRLIRNTLATLYWSLIFKHDNWYISVIIIRTFLGLLRKNTHIEGLLLLCVHPTICYVPIYIEYLK